jgi:pimeloyl-ACP methyl ester carboxylesterase
MQLAAMIVLHQICLGTSPPFPSTKSKLNLQPSFGNSYDPVTDPPNTKYYVDIFMLLFKSLALPKYHLFGHHSGASLAIEIASLYPSTILSLALCGPAIMTVYEQKELAARVMVPFNTPVAHGSHLLKTWEYLKGTGDDLVYKQQEVLDHVRAWKGRMQIYK